MRIVSALLAGLLAACTNVAEPPSSGANLGTGDVTRGLVYARENCGACHGVGDGDHSVNLAAPTFNQIADTPGMTRIALSAWMRSEHVLMPHYVVAPDDIDDVWAYIATLKARS